MALRFTCAAVLLLLLGCAGRVPTIYSAAQDATPEGNLLRVVTYNIAAGNGDLSRIVEVIQSTEADLVALQEVDVHWGERSNFEDQARTLAESLEMEYFFAPIYSFPPAREGLPAREFGLAILSRHPIVSARNPQITRLSTQSRAPVPALLPGFPEVVVEISGRRIRVYNTHLDYRRDPHVRRLQVAEMLEIIPASEPVLLLGDLNAEPQDDELAPLFQRLRDTWSPDSGDGRTYPANAPAKRIDYILASEHFETRAARVLPTDASDHLPVVADLTLRPH